MFHRLGRPDKTGFQPTIDGDEPGPATIVEDHLRFYTARSGCAVVYARETVFDDNALPRGEEVNVMLLTFSIKSKDPAKDDVMKVDCQKLADFSLEQWPNLDPGWLKLIEIAQSGFDRFCKPIPEAEETRRLAFLEQIRKGKDEGSAFRTRVSALDWQDALRLVQEPWQLEVVVSVHCGTRFDEIPQRFSTNSDRVSKMLKLHECEETRRKDLDGMVYYLAARDNLWCYSGD